ncbi:hypothetical protein FB451DRAFT_1242792 [Mycena latifolia]|nr:hypothetical protein FB451DRAFT_1242792 [Mycena latifolia]
MEHHPLSKTRTHSLGWRRSSSACHLSSALRVSIWSMAQRVAFFATVSGGGHSQLHSISLVCPTLVDSPTAIQPLPRRGSPLTELHLVGPAQLCDWVAHPGCGFDLSRLTDVQIAEGMSENLRSMLYGAHSTIRRVRLDPSVFSDCLSIAKLTSHRGGPGSQRLRQVDRSRH